MSKFSTNEVRSTVAAVLLALVCSSTFVLGAVAPANVTPSAVKPLA
jgi:hypothetical protein